MTHAKALSREEFRIHKPFLSGFAPSREPLFPSQPNKSGSSPKVDQLLSQCDELSVRPGNADNRVIPEHLDRVGARPAGFEPATCGLEVRCSIQLSYGRKGVFRQ